MGDTFEEALLNSLIATGYKIPSKDKGIMLSSGGAKEKASLDVYKRQVSMSSMPVGVAIRFLRWRRM